MKQTCGDGGGKGEGEGSITAGSKPSVMRAFFVGGCPITTDLPLLTPKTSGDALAAIEMSSGAECNGLVHGRRLYTA